jgi:hypothetical protein
VVDLERDLRMAGMAESGQDSAVQPMFTAEAGPSLEAKQGTGVKEESQDQSRINSSEEIRQTNEEE